MKRREVIQKLALGTAGGLMIPGLWSCNEDDVSPSIFDGRVAIIGAGVSGLYAAYLLNMQGVQVDIYEASDRVGGRLQYLQGFSDFPLELGADEVYGNNNVWYNLIQGQGIPTVERNILKQYVYQENIGTREELLSNPDFNAAINYIDGLSTYEGSDISVESSLNREGIPSNVHYIVNGEVSNLAGTSNSRLSAKGVSDQIKAMPNNGTGTHVLTSQSHIAIFTSLFESVLNKVNYNTPINSIDYTGEKIQLSDSNGGSYEADKVIIAVPVSILKENFISFNPGLPPSKRNALDTIGMDAGIKVAILFNGNFWGGQTSSIISDGVIPRYYAPGLGRSANNLVLAGYIMGEAAEAFSGFDDQAIIQSALDDLDRLYSRSASSLVSTDLDGNIEAVVKNWSDEPFIKGAYSYNKIGAGVSRVSLANPIQEKLFFAGEASNTNNNYGTVTGALEAAEEAVNRVIDAISTENPTTGA